MIFWKKYELLNHICLSLWGENEVRAMISKFITEGANNIGMIMAKFKGMEVDNKMVSQIAKELL